MITDHSNNNRKNINSVVRILSMQRLWKRGYQINPISDTVWQQVSVLATGQL